MSPLLRRLLHDLETALAALLAAGDGRRVVVAFSGGADSLALLLAAARLAPALDAEIHAFHLDHGLEAGSAERCESARRIAGRLGVACTSRRREVAGERRHGESLEEAARRIRYDELATFAEGLGAAAILTAHHRDDQVETVLLRLLAGSHWPGLAGIARQRGRIARPLLDWRRSELHAALDEMLAGTDLAPIADPSNHDLRFARNRIRRQLLPYLLEREPELVAVAAAVAEQATRARERVAARLAWAVEPAGIPLRRWLALPAALRREALRLLAEEARGGPGLRARVAHEVERVVATSPERWRCDAGRGFRFEARDGRLRLARKPEKPQEFSYTVEVPGGVEIPEAHGRFRARLATSGERAGATRAGRFVVTLRHPDRPGAWQLRSRRPGDRLRPAGGPGSRKLKELLIDRKIPVLERAHLPLLCRGEEIVWVPGVTTAQGWRAMPGEPAWIAEWERS